ncbi:primosomal protein N' [Rhodoplanes serenus]|uniref:primosomal protein N' n=1 Tax=Rhodoplanes serenus TaxID=200615 RepID=UPI000DAB5767|nr:primosomal protein N' [Rhodoplanes serenus]RAI32743.1 primosomal protein N' [Rhodoplanes serenus]
MARRIVDVLVPVALDHPYSYAAGDLPVAAGDVVRVPLGRRECTGVVWGDTAAPDPRLDNRIKEIAAKLDVPPLNPELRRLVDWVAGYTLAPRGMVLRMALRMGEGLGPARERVGVRLAGPPPERMTPARARLLALLADGLVRAKGDAAREAGVSAGVVDGLIDEGTLATVVLPPDPIAGAPDPGFRPPALSDAQATAAAALRDAVAAADFSALLVDGVTGSGKTEVYFEAVAEAVRRGRQSLILMPEIALTTQSLDRFAARFGVRPAEWHSEVSPRRRARTWQAVAEGKVPVVAGARSALFLPFRDLGLIVVDEEHDPAYKQEDGVRYHARDMAVVRASIAKIPIVLASATPSVETEVNARKGRYRRLPLPQRFGGQALPHVEAIDLSREGPPRGRWIAPRLAEAVKCAIERRQQALLFLNRRGYAPLTLCRGCGYRFACPQCDAWLVDHRFRRQLVCHHCGFSTGHPAACPNCEATDSFVACGPGVERLAEEVGTLFPQARALVMSSDLLTDVDTLREELRSIEEGRVDIVIGTQLVAKGHHFPRLNLVGIVDADLGLANGDPRAAERTFQLLAQVAGRAGREEGQGVGLIQTHQPEHPVMRALIAGDREAFYASEIATRERTGYPPFGRLASVIVSAATRPAAEAYARKLAAAAPRDERVRLLGPAEAPVSLLRGRHRFRLLLKAPRGLDLSGYVRDWLAAAPKVTGDLAREIDIDPMSFL